MRESIPGLSATKNQKIKKMQAGNEGTDDLPRKQRVCCPASRTWHM